jgi:hypothetical protein
MRKILTADKETWISRIFGALIILGPTNLFLKWVVPQAYVRGMLVDYLIPKLYLSDLPVFLLIGIACTDVVRALLSRRNQGKDKRAAQYFAGVVLTVLLFAALHIVTHGDLLTTRPIPFLFGVFQMIKGVLLLVSAVFLVRYVRIKTVLRSVVVMVMAEGALCVAQSALQRAVFGYWFFGEPDLRVAYNVAKTTVQGAVRILPYGTTPHPNVIAAWMGAAGIGLMYAITSMRQKTSLKTVILLTAALLLAITVLVAAESLTAQISVLITTAALFTFAAFRSHKKKRLGTALILSIVCGILFFAAPSLLQLDAFQTETSVVRRSELITIAQKLIRQNWVNGVGLSQFTAVSETVGTVSDSVRFLQPVHHAGLLWVAETGIAGTAAALLLVFLIFNIVQLLYSPHFHNLTLVLIFLFPLLSLDHYLLTLQTGNILCTIILSMMLRKKD